MHFPTQEGLRKSFLDRFHFVKLELENAIREDELTPWTALDRASVISNRLTTRASYFSSSFGAFYFLKEKAISQYSHNYNVSA